MRSRLIEVFIGHVPQSGDELAQLFTPQVERHVGKDNFAWIVQKLKALEHGPRVVYSLREVHREPFVTERGIDGHTHFRKVTCVTVSRSFDSYGIQVDFRYEPLVELDLVTKAI
jgi:hypothetical protein